MGTTPRRVGASIAVALAVSLPAVALAAPADAAPKKYSAKQVAKHSSASDCWTVVQGNVYDVTSWISRHPGGASAITGMCGRDATASFTSEHGGDSEPAAELASFRIGRLRK